MRIHWKVCTLGESEKRGEIELTTGPFGTQLKAAEYVENGTPVINVRNIGLGEIRDEKLEYLSSITVNRLLKHLLKSGDIVFGRKGAVDRHAFIKKKQDGWFQGSDCLRLRVVTNDIEPRFLSYCFLIPEHRQWMINQCSHGATMSSLNQDVLKRILLRIPPISTQRKIVSILANYDGLIENNSQRIAILEEMARRIYEEWFVNFRFPGHENHGFVDSSIGRIPKGWEVVPFTEIADVFSGGTPKTNVQEYWGGSIPFFAPKDSPDFCYVTNTEKKITEIGLRKCNSKLYAKDTVFITARGTVGKIVMPSIDMAMNQSCYALRGKEGITQLYLFWAVRERVDYLKRNTGGATFDTIVVDTFKRMFVSRPSSDIIFQFTKLIQPEMELILNLLNRNTILRTTRDLLLPKLISGEIDVSETVNFAEKAVAL
jgi:type I restriction enzyme S subunit